MCSLWVTQIVQMGEHWYGSPEDLRSIPGLGARNFSTYAYISIFVETVNREVDMWSNVPPE